MALISGGALRLGRSIVECLSKDLPVVIHCRRSLDEALKLQEALKQDGRQVGVVQGDFSSELETSQLLDKAAEALGSDIDVVINNASMFEHDDLDTLSLDSFQRHMQANCFAPMQLTAALSKKIKERRSKGEEVTGCVINILDQKLYNPNPDHISYTASKYALMGMTDTLARGLASDGIRVNAVSPGFVLDNVGDGLTGDNLKKAQSCSPLGRGPSPKDVAEAVRYLIQASSVTGQIIYVDGGERFNARKRDVAFEI
jgi:NAD(P)-dependent dehydrogenase (short-subunit alcohol dehydrogenase family)